MQPFCFCQLSAAESRKCRALSIENVSASGSSFWFSAGVTTFSSVTGSAAMTGLNAQTTALQTNKRSMWRIMVKYLLLKVEFRFPAHDRLLRTNISILADDCNHIATAKATCRDSLG
jgi:hypothetical protein